MINQKKELGIEEGDQISVKPIIQPNGYLGKYELIEVKKKDQNSSYRLFVKYNKDKIEGEENEFGLDWNFFNIQYKLHLREVTFYKYIGPKFNFAPKLVHSYTNEIGTGYIVLEDVFYHNGIILQDKTSFQKGLTESEIYPVFTYLAQLHCIHLKLDQDTNNLIDHILSQCEKFSQEKILTEILKPWSRLKSLCLENSQLFTESQLKSLSEREDLHDIVQAYISKSPCKTQLLNHSFSHGDLWSGNILQPQKKSEQQLDRIYLIDWQFFDRRPGFSDIVLLLYSSLQSNLFNRIKEFLEYYYNELLKEADKDHTEIPWALFEEDYQKCKVFGFVPFVVSFETFLLLAKNKEEEKEIRMRTCYAVKDFLFNE